MDRDELLLELIAKIHDRFQAARALEDASNILMTHDKAIDDLIDQLQPRIEVTKQAPEWKRPEPETPSERVHDALLHAGRQLSPGEIALFTGLSLKQVGPCLGALVKANRVRNAGNGTWTAA